MIGSAPNKPDPRSGTDGFCEHPFTQLNITADGRVGRCCADFYFADVMGNVTRQSVVEIWRGKPLQEARGHLLRGDRSKSALCSRCDFQGVPQHGLSFVSHLISTIVYRMDERRSGTARGARPPAGEGPPPPGAPEPA